MDGAFPLSSLVYYMLSQDGKTLSCNLFRCYACFPSTRIRYDFSGFSYLIRVDPLLSGFLENFKTISEVDGKFFKMHC